MKIYAYKLASLKGIILQIYCPVVKIVQDCLVMNFYSFRYVLKDINPDCFTSSCHLASLVNIAPLFTFRFYCLIMLLVLQVK